MPSHIRLVEYEHAALDSRPPPPVTAAFVAWNGFALDHKTPLLRSHDAIQKQGIRLLRLLGDNDSKRFTSYLGWEQEFFVVTTEMYLARPDLRNCGRTLMGALPPRHQQSDMNYFAAMPDRVKAARTPCCCAI